MKRIFILIAIGLIFICGTLTAEEAVLIDFSELTADYPADNPTENSKTLTDFSDVAGSTFSTTEKMLMKTSLALNNWEVELSSSSRTIATTTQSLTKEAKISDTAEEYQGEEMAGKNVLGVRVYFPSAPFNSYAIIEPPFEIPAYADEDVIQQDGTLLVPDVEKGLGNKFNNVGVAKNIGILKSLSITVRGLNFPHGLGVILKNENNEEKIIFMNYLNFDGWRTLTWENPNYITEVSKRELQVYPLYPKSAPFYKLVGVIVYRDANVEGGDFITYIKDIRVKYDKAILDVDRDIDDENVWGILQKREDSRRAAELRRLGNLHVLRFLEQKKMHLDVLK